MRNRLCRTALCGALACAAVLHAAPAQSACGPADAGFSPQGGPTAVAVSVDVTQERVLLGPHGKRIATHAQPIWLTESGDPLPRTWMDKVEWSAYRADGSDAATRARLLFDAQGRLCRVERLDSPKFGKPAVSGGHTFEYDDAGALRRVAEYERTGGPTYTLVGQVCLQRDARDALGAYIAGGCEDGGTTAASRRYVRDTAGKLLRVIDAAAPHEPVTVQTYDEQGQPAARYVRRLSPFAAPAGGEGLDAYAEPASTQDRLHVIGRDALARLATEAPGNEWRIVRVNDDVPLDDTDMVSWDPGSQTVLAEGMTGPEGESLLDRGAQDRVWKAMQDDPGRILWYTGPMSRVVLVPAMAAATWRACSDPGNASRDACL